MSELKTYYPNTIEDQPLSVSSEDSPIAVGSQAGGGNTVVAPASILATAIPTRGVARELLSLSLDTMARTILGNFTFGQVGAIQIGEYVSGTSGDIKISPNGLVGRNSAGTTTFSIDGTTGNATFLGTISAGSVVVGYTRSFVSTIAWTSTDQDTASWSTGTVTDAGGTAYSIASGNTGNIAAKTYIYLDPDVSITVLQTTTTATNAVGGSKILLAIVTAGASASINCAIDVITSSGTVIDGGRITTNSVTLSQLNFTPLTSSGATGAVIATINASVEGIAIDADNISISGSTTFSAGYDPTSKVAALAGSYNSAASAARISIFPDANTGIVAYTTDGTSVVFKVEVGGTNVGDVTLGNYAGGVGMLWDQSAGALYIKGNMTAGSIDGVTITGGTITGSTIKTKSTGVRVQMDANDSNIGFYDAGNDLVGEMDDNGTDFYIQAHDGRNLALGADSTGKVYINDTLDMNTNNIVSVGDIGVTTISMAGAIDMNGNDINEIDHAAFNSRSTNPSISWGFWAFASGGTYEMRMKVNGDNYNISRSAV